MAVAAKRKDAREANGSATNNGTRIAQNHEDEQKRRDREERKSLVLWKRPIVTTEYFIKETSTLLYTYGEK